ncbi:hypothetical protein [Marinomonas communis]|uniref:Uncharacterized protein n=1 Tax=Marinomonas communis TaxID=28254 RepID=A0A4R6X0V6_9GAMM|nr:hypothetical protein [Marinomonas communis]TDR12472.1 hypothetical protein C8D85_2507 [Marinomonas communis]
MIEIKVEVGKNFINIPSGISGYSVYISQLEAFGKILFNSGSIIELDLVSSKLKSSDGKVVVDIPTGVQLNQFLGEGAASPTPNHLDTPIHDCSKCNVKPLPDELALSEITGLHTKVRQAMRKTSGLSRDLIPLSSDEVMDFLRVLPITLVQEKNKNVCVSGIHSYLLASSHIKSSKKVPVRWYTGKMGMPLERLIMVELLTLPFALGLNKRQYQPFLSCAKSAFNYLYKNSFYNSHHSEKQIAAHLGIDERTLKKDSYDA